MAMKTYIITIDERTKLGKTAVEKLKSLGVEMKKIDKRKVTSIKSNESQTCQNKAETR